LSPGALWLEAQFEAYKYMPRGCHVRRMFELIDDHEGDERTCYYCNGKIRFE